ncbi:MAG: sterol desaturase family protein [Bacteroidia bacterium]|nr:sterol desaturase family protein [Bacteroidia bacterium]MDW8159579.1 sterol desaturase family protein [Bacteroidia bacterium]
MKWTQVEIVTFLILIISTLVIIILERIFPYTPGLKFFRKGFWTDFFWYTLVQSYVLKIIIFDYIILPLDNKFQFSSLQLVTSWPIWVQVLFFLFLHDFYIYWFHRLQHTNKILWRTHEAHHSNTEVDWIAGARSHSLEILINQTIEFAPIIFLGAAPEVVPIKALIDAVWGNYIHSNIDVRSGFLVYIINGPELHRWHHADDKRVFFANYATKFAFWDWIFGTAFLPANEKPQKFGLYYPYPNDYLLQHIFAFWRFDVEKFSHSKAGSLYCNTRQKLLLFWEKILGKLVKLK